MQTDRNPIHTLFFLGIGGIGMSALARYYRAKGCRVLGYDRTMSPLTAELEKEDMRIVYSDDKECASRFLQGLSPVDTLVVRTPAIPEDEPLYVLLRERGFTILKRAELLGQVTRAKDALCVAGTHGKTTTSTLLAHLLHHSSLGTSAFLGGISNNLGSNLLIDSSSQLVVVEADEYDRSFHHLRPSISVITSIDPDHLDVYGTAEAYQESFEQYAQLVSQTILLKQGYHLQADRLKAQLLTYGVDGTTDGSTEQHKADFYADHIEATGGEIYFDFHTPTMCVERMHLGVPAWVNIENAVAAMAVASLRGVTAAELRQGLETFRGVKRRFDVHVKTPELVYIDDYAHHPTELQASIGSVKRIYPDRHTIGIFQPHLFTRTRDFMDAFARVLSQLDEVVLLPIYPARERPIEGISSDALCGKMTTTCSVIDSRQVVSYIVSRVKAVSFPLTVLTLGAGDIDRLVPELTQALTHAYE